MTDIGKRIKEVRKSTGLAQQEFADCLGVKRIRIVSYEGGKAIPNEPTVSLICREFKVSEEWLRNGIGEMFLPNATDTLDQLTREYHLSSYGRKMIERFVSLPANQRNAIEEFVASFADDVTNSESAPSWIDLEVEDYRRELEKQEKQNPKPQMTLPTAQTE